MRGRVTVAVVVRVVLGDGHSELAGRVRLCQRVETIGLRGGRLDRVGPRHAGRVTPVVGAVGMMIHFGVMLFAFLRRQAD